MSKRKKETVYLSQLDGLRILWPGDVRALAEFVLRSFEARDRIVVPGVGTKGAILRKPEQLTEAVQLGQRLAVGESPPPRP